MLDKYYTVLNNLNVTYLQFNVITNFVNKNTPAEDKYGNKIIIPDGFRVSSDSGTDVTKGVVIEDNSGNQFVWIPVGKIYTDTEKTESSAKTINLDRYTFDINTGVPIAHGDAVINNSYQELETSTYGNTTAKNIANFKASVATNGGYYIGRYEAGDSSAVSERTDATDGTLVCKSNQYVYNYINQPNAATKCRNMYANSNFSSDLINSYAWDTAVVFIQTFGGDAEYSISNYSSSFAKTGVNEDKYCNIHDLSGNAFEWITETNKNQTYPNVYRGGAYSNYDGGNYLYTGIRGATSGNQKQFSFRPLLYIN